MVAVETEYVQEHINLKHSPLCAPGMYDRDQTECLLHMAY